MRRLPLTLGLAMLLCGIVASSASPESEIVIRGASSGSHLRLEVEGSKLVVHGRLAHSGQTGCRSRRQGTTSCGLGHAGRIVIETGPGGDKVEVLDRLPIPLTAYLGTGSDKLIGNGEPDTCYPQGTHRNRCIGGPGADTCIAKPVNTDCVGGAGDDYCKVSDGSDGCWGGPGNDTCVMGRGQDGCHGEAGDDRLFGGPGADQLYGGPGFDYCDGGPGRGRSHECEAGPRH